MIAMPVSPRVLFVDDEPAVLAGLFRAMRSVSPDWTTQFAGSALEAMRLLATQPIDVVVSDLRMPGMSGDELQREVLLRYPWIVRIILSGMVDEASVAKGSRWSERYLAKPCSPLELRRGVLEAIDARERDRTEDPAGPAAPTAARPPAILYIQEQAEDLALMTRAFAAGAIPVTLIGVPTGHAALARLTAAKPPAGDGATVAEDVDDLDTILLDLSSRPSIGYEFLARYRATDTLRHLPIVVLAPARTGDDLRDPVSHGAAWSLSRPVAWDGYLETARMIARFAQQAAVARRHAGRNPATVPLDLRKPA